MSTYCPGHVSLAIGGLLLAVGLLFCREREP